MIELKYTKENNAFNLIKATSDAAGFDLASIEEIYLEPGERRKIRTGIKVEIPKGYFGLVRPRSGTATKQGLDICSSGVVDADYRGELFVVLINHDSIRHTIFNGMRIAQLVIIPIPDVNLNLVESLSETIRGEGGFGSTGIASL